LGEEDDGLLALDKNDNKERIRGNPNLAKATNTNEKIQSTLSFEDDEADIAKIKEVRLKECSCGSFSSPLTFRLKRS
jgi:hypothetical protein